VDLEAWARAEMAKAAADPVAFERRLKERLEQRLAGRRRFQAHDNDGVWVEEVRGGRVSSSLFRMYHSLGSMMRRSARRIDPR